LSSTVQDDWLIQGFTLFFTGLSGSGKSTIANVVLVKLLEIGGRPVTLLDGDIGRKNLSSELGFSKEHRDLNIRRIGFVATEIAGNGGIAICAPIAPYDATRKDIRRMIEPRGGFVLIHMATPIEVCEERDRKGLYAKARAGILKEFTGISDPYEEPTDADLVIDTSGVTPAGRPADNHPPGPRRIHRPAQMKEIDCASAAGLLQYLKGACDATGPCE
jgi:sulfate adenylyltransferase